MKKFSIGDRVELSLSRRFDGETITLRIEEKLSIAIAKDHKELKKSNRNIFSMDVNKNQLRQVLEKAVKYLYENNFRTTKEQD